MGRCGHGPGETGVTNNRQKMGEAGAILCRQRALPTPGFQTWPLLGEKTICCPKPPFVVTVTVAP